MRAAGLTPVPLSQTKIFSVGILSWRYSSYLRMAETKKRTRDGRLNKNESNSPDGDDSPCPNLLSLPPHPTPHLHKAVMMSTHPRLRPSLPPFLD